MMLQNLYILTLKWHLVHMNSGNFNLPLTQFNVLHTTYMLLCSITLTLCVV